MEPSVPFDRLRAALDEVGHSQAVLSHPETLASIGCFEVPVEDWPVSTRLSPSPRSFLILTRFEHTL